MKLATLDVNSLLNALQHVQGDRTFFAALMLIAAMSDSKFVGLVIDYLRGYDVDLYQAQSALQLACKSGALSRPDVTGFYATMMTHVSSRTAFGHALRGLFFPSKVLSTCCDNNSQLAQ